MNPRDTRIGCYGGTRDTLCIFGEIRLTGTQNDMKEPPSLRSTYTGSLPFVIVVAIVGFVDAAENNNTLGFISVLPSWLFFLFFYTVLRPVSFFLLTAECFVGSNLVKHGGEGFSPIQATQS